MIISYLGLFVRPASDDYCLAPATRSLGVLGLAHDYYLHRNGRVANALASAAVYLGGGFLTKLLPGVLVTALVIAIGGSVALLVSATTNERPRTALASGAAVGTVTTATICWGARNSYQVVLWAPGSISYLLPGVVLTLFVLVAIAAHRRHTPLLCLAGGVVGCTVATLSESFALTGGTLVATLLLYYLAHGPRTDAASRIALATEAGIGIGLIILVTSPGAAERRATTRNPLSVSQAVQQASVVYGHVLRLAFNRQVILPTLAIGALLGLLLGPPGIRVSARLWLVATGLVLPPIMAFEVLVALGYGYGRDGWRFSRVWQGFLIPSVLLIALVLYLITAELARRVRSATALRLAAVVPLVLLGLVGVSQVRAAERITMAVVERAAAWDAQAAGIRQAAPTPHDVIAYRALPIAGLATPYLRPRGHDYWASCVAQYFGVRGIRPPTGDG